MQVFVIIGNAEIMINADLNINNWLTKEYVIMDLIGILVIVNIREYLNYENCKCRQRLIDKLVKNYIENIDESTVIYNKALNVIPLKNYKKICSSCQRSSCTIYIALLVMFFMVSLSIRDISIYFHWYLKSSIKNY